MFGLLSHVLVSICTRSHKLYTVLVLINCTLDKFRNYSCKTEGNFDMAYSEISINNILIDFCRGN